MSDAKDFYRKNHWKDSPVFHQPWWLDAVSGDHWDVALIKREHELAAYYLYAYRKDGFGLHLTMPYLTQFLGPNYVLSGKNTRERNNEEMNILELLLNQLPRVQSFESRWQFKFQNWLPFYWSGYQQRTRYTYLLENISNANSLRENFSEKIEREISKANRQFRIEEATDVSEFWALLLKNFHNKRLRIPFGESFLAALLTASIENQSGKILLAKNDSGAVAAGIFVVWDANTAYYIIGGKNDDFGNSGAMSLLFWNTFAELSTNVSTFDFEGSMIKGVENYFRSFGAARHGFFEITKIHSPLLKIKSGFKSLFDKK